MRKFIVSAIAVLAVFGTGAVSASALTRYQPEPVQVVEPADIAEPTDPVPVDPVPVDPVPVDPVPVQPVDPVPVDPDPVVPVPLDPVKIAPLGWGAVHLRGDVFANGHPFGPIDFAILWNEDDPSEAQLWALLENVPTKVCEGRIFETPAGEPIFFGSTSLMGPAGTCHMARLPDHSAISLFAASNDGQWVTSIMTGTNRALPVPIFD